MQKCYVVDAFAEKVFEGNPAAVCILTNWLADDLMMNIASENNLSETAFAVKTNKGYTLRWFTPTAEIDLCGHATLATAYVIMNYYEPNLTEVHFSTQSGELTVNRKNNLYEMNFPAYELTQVPVTNLMKEVIGVRPLEAWMGRDLVCVLEKEQDVQNANPDEKEQLKLEGALLHITAKGTTYDCVSRSFAPKMGVKEDPVCGSGHCHIVPLWARKLQKEDVLARQRSTRGGTLYCKTEGDRVLLSGKAQLYSIAELQI